MTRVTKDISLSQIDMDRLPLCPKTVSYAVTVMTQGREVFPPIKVAKKANGRFEIRDGRHRWLAHKLAGEPKILAKFSEESLRQ